MAKIDSALRRVLEDQGDAVRLRHHGASWGVEVFDIPQLTVFVRVAIYCESSSSLEDLIRRKEMDVGPLRNDIGHLMKGVRSGRVDVSLIPSLAEHPAVYRIELSPKRHARLDLASKAVGLSEYKNKSGRSGKNVIIGVIDSGIDGRHSAFSNQILAVWEQSESERPDASRISHGLLINNDVEKAIDSTGHGTHVASIAAGLDPQYGGVAQGAKLIVVKCNGDDLNIIEGIDFILNNAEKVGLPVVVNISLGGHQDPHDGSGRLGRFIDGVSGPGKIICCAAGNEGNLPIHAVVPAGAKNSCDVEFSVPRVGRCSSSRNVLIHAWVESGQDFVLAVSDSKRVELVRVQINASIDGVFVRHEHGRIRLEVSTDFVPETGGLLRVSINLSPSLATDYKSIEGKWRIKFISKVFVSNIHLWIMDYINGEESSKHSQFVGTSVHNSMRIGAPGSSISAVTVASFATRAGWTCQLGKWHKGSGLTVGDIAANSSDGPLRNNIHKPDIAAPGAMIIAALSSKATLGDGDGDFIVSNKHQAQGGTSMASPFVAGVIALLLEKQKYLTPDDVKYQLAQMVSPSSKTRQMRSRWGHGKLDMSVVLPAGIRSPSARVVPRKSSHSGGRPHKP